MKRKFLVSREEKREFLDSHKRQKVSGTSLQISHMISFSEQMENITSEVCTPREINFSNGLAFYSHLRRAWHVVFSAFFSSILYSQFFSVGGNLDLMSSFFLLSRHAKRVFLRGGKRKALWFHYSEEFLHFNLEILCLRARKRRSSFLPALID